MKYCWKRVPEKEPRESRESRRDWRTKETHDAGNGKGVFFIWEALLIFEAKHPNIDWYTKVAAAIQNAVQCYRVICDEKSFPDSSVGKESACNAEDPNLIPGSERSAGEGTGYPLQYSWASHVDQLVKNLPAMQETLVRFLGHEVPLEKGQATHSSILGLPWWLRQ